MRSLKLLFLPAILVLSQISLPVKLWAGEPTDQVRQTADKVFALLRDAQLKGPNKKDQRRLRLRQIIGTRFDFEEMAKRSLGANWRRVNDADRKRFVRLFTALLERSYTGEIESYNGEKIVYTREKVTQNEAEVDSKVITDKGQEYAVNYKMMSQGGEWKVYDVIIENVSLVNNYRSQFNRILATDTFDDLLRKLETKSPEVKDART